MTSDGIVALLAALTRCTSGVFGLLPNDPESSAVMRASGILDQFPHTWRDIPKQGLLFTKRSGRQTEPELAAECVDFACKKLGTTRSTHHASYRAVIECMANTKNHAGGDASIKQEWYMHVQNDTARNVVGFTFLDFGVGIVRSLKRRLPDEILQTLALRSDADMLAGVFAGEFESRTGKRNRGIGLKSIAELAKQHRFDRLVAVANRGFVDVEHGRQERLHSKFPGTVIYWEISKPTVEETRR